MSMEFLMGRSLLNALYNLDVKEPYTEALQEMGYSLENLVQVQRWDLLSDSMCASGCLVAADLWAALDHARV